MFQLFGVYCRIKPFVGSTGGLDKTMVSLVEARVGMYPGSPNSQK